MITIRLHGHLKEIFGSVYEFEAKTVKEAIHALDCNFPSFKKELTKEGRRYYVIVNEKEDYADQNKLYFPIANNSVIDLVPEVEGGGFNIAAVFAVIVGVLLVIYAAPLAMGVMSAAGGGTFAGGFAMGASSALFGVSGAATLSTAIGYLGAGLISMGIASMLAPDTPKMQDGGGAKSSAFSSGENVMAQGAPVPVGYGRLIIGSNVISFTSESTLHTAVFSAQSRYSNGYITDVYNSNNSAYDYQYTWRVGSTYIENAEDYTVVTDEELGNITTVSGGAGGGGGTGHGALHNGAYMLK